MLQSRKCFVQRFPTCDETTAQQQHPLLLTFFLAAVHFIALPQQRDRGKEKYTAWEVVEIIFFHDTYGELLCQLDSAPFISQCKSPIMRGTRCARTRLSGKKVLQGTNE